MTGSRHPSFISAPLSLTERLGSQRPGICNYRISCVASAEPSFFPSIRSKTADLFTKYKVSLKDLDWDKDILLLTTYVAPLDPEYLSTAEELAELSSDLMWLLDEEKVMPTDVYTLQVSTPGTNEYLTVDKDFESFRSFGVTVVLKKEFKRKMEFKGTLVERTVDEVRINLKGRIIGIPRDNILDVKLDKTKKLA